MRSRLVSILVTAAFLTGLLVGPARADWPHLRGPGLDGRIAAPSGLGDGAPGLALDWKIPLGSGYSGIAVQDGRVVTMFSQELSDWVAAFDLDTGTELWRYRLDSVNPGRDGSTDGPISSPVIDGDRVYALGAKGQLVALGLETGERLWIRTMQELGGKEPGFGYGVAPLVAGGHLVLTVGGDLGAIVGLDLETGETQWSAGSGDADYQVPTVVTLAGKEQVVTSLGKTLLGLDPETGSLLWTHEAEEGNPGSGVTFAGENRFLVDLSGTATVFQVDKPDDDFVVREVFRSRELGGTYSVPVYSGGHLFGFRGDILSCIDAETGARVWRSRPPGGRGLILLGNYLAIFGSGGNVVLASASPLGYHEVARVQALESSGYTWPSYSEGRILVRNLSEMAAVSIGGETTEVASESSDRVGAFGEFLESLEGETDKNEQIESYLEDFESMPIVEGNRAHFVYLGDADDMAVTGTMVADGAPKAMARVAGSDLFHRSFEVEAGGRWEYQFIRNFSERIPDPRNARLVPARQGDGEVSEFTLPGYSLPGHLEERADKIHGSLVSFTFDSKILGLERKVDVYLPVGYLESENDYPLLVVYDGGDWLKKGLLNRTLDNTIGRTIRPVVVAFLHAIDEWWVESGGTGTDEHADMLVTELIPLLEERYRLAEGRDSRALMGNTGFAVTSLYTALKHRDKIGGVAIQSPNTSLGFEGRLMELIAKRPPADLTLYFDWSRYEVKNLDVAIDFGAESRRLAKALEADGYSFVGGEVIDSAGWGGWRARSDKILETLFPLNPN